MRQHTVLCSTVDREDRRTSLEFRVLSSELRVRATTLKIRHDQASSTTHQRTLIAAFPLANPSNSLSLSLSDDEEEVEAEEEMIRLLLI